MPTEAIILNGGSSAGKSTIARCLQTILPGIWLTFSVDTLVDAMPPTAADLDIAADGSVAVGPEFHLLDVAWSRGIATMVQSGARIIIDDVFLGGASSQERWRTAMKGAEVLWVGVRCTPASAATRESARPDRPAGMAASQAHVVHVGVTYDVEVDTTSTDALTCAHEISAHVGL